MLSRTSDVLTGPFMNGVLVTVNSGHELQAHSVDVTFTFTFRPFGRRFYPKRLTKSACVEGDSNVSLWYIKIRIELVLSVHSCEANRTSFIIVAFPP